MLTAGSGRGKRQVPRNNIYPVIGPAGILTQSVKGAGVVCLGCVLAESGSSLASSKRHRVHELQCNGHNRVCKIYFFSIICKTGKSQCAAEDALF